VGAGKLVKKEQGEQRHRNSFETQKGSH
jgi:hypothetical protein